MRSLGGDGCSRIRRLGGERARGGGEAAIDPERSLLMAFVTESTLAIYHQRVADGKALPANRIADISVQLVCHGAATCRRIITHDAKRDALRQASQEPETPNA